MRMMVVEGEEGRLGLFDLNFQREDLAGVDQNRKRGIGKGGRI